MNKFYHSLTLAVLTIIALTALGYEYYSCDGTLVRGLFWMECINE